MRNQYMTLGFEGMASPHKGLKTMLSQQSPAYKYWGSEDGVHQVCDGRCANLIQIAKLELSEIPPKP